MIPSIEPQCRYCKRPGLKCTGTGSSVNTACAGDTINGGDTAPSSWSGDVSSGAQLVFDSTNWNVPQTVKVTARDDDVFEPKVSNAWQSAKVHHYVVSQDKNLVHTYYDTISVARQPPAPSPDSCTITVPVLESRVLSRYSVFMIRYSSTIFQYYLSESRERSRRIMKTLDFSWGTPTYTGVPKSG